MFKVKTKVMVGLLAALLLLPAAAFAGEPFVTTDWLQGNLSKVTVVDVRKVEEYNEGHIPGAINVFYGVWGIKKGVLLNELPSDDDLRDILSAAGIEPATAVVVVSKNETMPLRTDATRVAWTLRYAGVENVAVLSGGIEKWVAEKKAVSKDAVKPKAKGYKGKFNKQFFASKADVMGALGKAVLADVRPPEFFKGEKKLDFVAKTGRIKGAVNLPPGALFNAGRHLQEQGGNRGHRQARRGGRSQQGDHRLLRHRQGLHNLVAGPRRPAGLQEREGLRRLLHGMAGGPRSTRGAVKPNDSVLN